MRRIFATIIAAIVASLALIPGSASAGGGCHSDVFSDEATTQVNLQKNCFTPTVARVRPGDTVTFTSSDPEPHAVTGAANSWGTDSKIHPGGSATYQFDEPGVYPYFCFFHPSMVGAVVVGDGAAASAATARNSVKAVSAQVPGGEAVDDEPAAIVEEDSGGGGRTVPVVVGVGVLVTISGLAGAFVLRRKVAASDQ